MQKKLIPSKPQQLIIDFILKNPRCNIWGSMGLGKTSATLVALDIAYLSGVYTGKTLIIAPLRVAQSTWTGEAKKWKFYSLEVQAIIGSAKQREKALDNKTANVFTINFENVPWLIEKLGSDWDFEHIVCDESTKLKSFRLRGGSKRAKALSKIAFTKAKTWVNLTGTPAPNGLLNLWGQNYFIDRGSRLGLTYGAFTSRWFKDVSHSDSYQKLVPYSYAQAQIEQKLSDVCLTLSAYDYMPLDKPVFVRVEAPLPPLAMRKYKELEKVMFTELESGSEVEALNAASATMKCLQICSGAIYTEQKNWEEIHTAKILALESIIEEAAGAPVIVVYHWKHDLVRIKKAFKEARELDKNPETMDAWNRGEIPILLIHPASAGHGISLQDGGNIMIFFSHWWNLEEAEQVIERIGPTRQYQSGYNRPVFVYEIVAPGTIDELVIQCKRDKSTVQSALMSAMRSANAA